MNKRIRPSQWLVSDAKQWMPEFDSFYEVEEYHRAYTQVQTILVNKLKNLKVQFKFIWRNK